MNTKKTKSSSGDTSATHPYLKDLVGQEVETSVWKNGKPVIQNGRILTKRRIL